MNDDKPADALRGLIEAQSNDAVSLNEFEVMCCNFVSAHGDVLLDRLERQDQRIAELEKALRYYGDNYHDDGKCARAALTDGSQP